MQTWIISISHNLIFTSRNVSIRLYLIKPQCQVPSVLKMLPYVLKLSNISKDNILLSTTSGYRKFFRELECWQVNLLKILGFYASAVLLRYEYPMMIITKTKEIFFKRLKRNKKMLTEEGSSDESKSATMSRSI